MSYFDNLKKKIDEYDGFRQQIIKLSSDITKKSKKAIFEVHRDNIEAAQKLLQEVRSNIEKVEELAKSDEKLRYEGSFRASLEEFVEAEIFMNYVISGEIINLEHESLGFKEIIGGLCDFSGEVVRRARLHVTAAKYDTLEQDYQVIHDLMEELLAMNLSSYLRTKFDQMKRNVYNMEQIRYSVALKG